MILFYNKPNVLCLFRIMLQQIIEINCNKIFPLLMLINGLFYSIIKKNQAL